MNDIKKDDEMYCLNCGKVISKNAAFCPLCGVQLKEIKISEKSVLVPLKSKTVSVVLAVFFGFWSWLYTYRKDQIKFWIFLGILTTMWVSYTGYACSSIGDALTNSNFDMYNYESNISIFSKWIFAVGIIGWFWALIDATRRPSSFYFDYPNG